jgi:pSer/pThr/pTyr-binding forkhead associated (FHA) protein
MGILLEIKTGPFAGKKVGGVSGQTVTFGRAAGRAQYAFPQDTFMSGVHFAVECAANGCRAIDQKSSNGTFLNGARIKDAMLANGDEIKGGQTVFTVKILADAKLASLISAGEELPTSVPAERRRADEPVRPAAPAKSQPAKEIPAAPAEAAGQASPPRREPLAAPSPAKRVPVPAERVPPAEAAPAESVPKAPPLGASRQGGVEQLPKEASKPAIAQPNLPASDMLAADSAGRSAKAPAAQAERIERPGSRGAASARGFAFSVMGWSFPPAPAEWQVQEGFGLQHAGHDEFPSSVAASEELLGGITLQQFVESQISTLRGYLRDPKIEPTMPPRVGGADESMAVDVHHAMKDGRELVYRRIYARSGGSVGVLTVTTLASEFPQVLESLQPLLEGAAFHSTVNN